MSLINEALKKAQERQSSAPRPASMGENQGYSQAAPPKSTNWVLIGIAAFATILVVSLGTGLIVYGVLEMQKESSSDSADIQTAELPADAVSQLESENLPSSNLERISFDSPVRAEPAPTPTVVESPIQSTTEKSQIIKQSPEALTVTSEAVQTTQSEQPSAPKQTADPKPIEANYEVQAYIDALKIRGVMPGSQKVLIFDPSIGSSTAYEAGSRMSTPLRVEIQAINDRSIEFLDHAGYTYTKRF